MMELIKKTRQPSPAQSMYRQVPAFRAKVEKVSSDLFFIREKEITPKMPRERNSTQDEPSEREDRVDSIGVGHLVRGGFRLCGCPKQLASSERY